MAIANMIGFVDADPASRNDMFIDRSEEGRDAGQRAEDQADADAISPKMISQANQVSACVVEQHVEEVAIPLEA